MEGQMQKDNTATAWLAMRYGCCASSPSPTRARFGDGRDWSGLDGQNATQVCSVQPQSIAPPLAKPLPVSTTYSPSRPSTSYSVSNRVSHWVSSSRDFASRTSISLTRPRRSHSLAKSRPSISRPMDFRHCDSVSGLDGIQGMLDDAPMPVRRRRSFRPLELSIYLPDGCGRLSPLPDFGEEDWSSIGLEKPRAAHVRERDSRTHSLSSDPSTSEYLIQRKPLPSAAYAHSRRSSTQSQKSMSTTQERRLSGTTLATMQTPILSPWPEEPQSSAISVFAMDRDAPTLTPKASMRRSHTSRTLSPVRVLSRLPSPSRSRSNTAPSRPGSLRRAKTEADVDDAIRELNTIVEERRASAYRNSCVPTDTATTAAAAAAFTHHIPSIAPSMRVHARSETLSDIGSAFAQRRTAGEGISRPGSAMSRRTMGTSLAIPNGPLNSNPLTPPAPVTPTTPVSARMARLGAWLRKSTGSGSAGVFKNSSAAASEVSVVAPAGLQDKEPFYKCIPPTTTTPSRPTSASSQTITHSRQDSTDSAGTATVTLFSASSRASSPEPIGIAKPLSSSSAPSTTPSTTTPSTTHHHPLRGQGKTRRIPTPLTLYPSKEKDIEAALASARSLRKEMNERPPASPHYGRLPGMERRGRDVGGIGVPSPGAVGVAF